MYDDSAALKLTEEPRWQILILSQFQVVLRLPPTHSYFITIPGPCSCPFEKKCHNLQYHIWKLIRRQCSTETERGALVENPLSFHNYVLFFEVTPYP